ncbi:MAG: HAD-IA family hydrolase [Thiobacillaceae bacterium]
MTEAVLFDLDGTLIDTAPDLGHALNLQRARHGMAPLEDAVIRPQASHGARGLMFLAFDLRPDDPQFATMREEFLQLYADNLSRHSRAFEGVLDLLDELENRGIAWGVVTNKPARFTEPLLSMLDLADRAACIVSGDTCPQPKPHPCPLLYAAEEAGHKPEHCIYVGDAARDVEAAVAARMPALVALWGYLGVTDKPQAWGARGLVASPAQILDYLD